MGRIEARPALLAAVLMASSALAACGRTPAPETPNNAAAELALSEENEMTVVVAPGTYFPDWPSLEQREYDEARTFGLREVLPPPAPAAQVPLRSSLETP
jgi:hypothetical protein